MGMVGRWIDSLTDAERDRIIEHPDPTFDGYAWRSGRCGCLVGCTIPKDGWVETNSQFPIPRRFAERAMVFGETRWIQIWPEESSDPALHAGLRFPDLTDRFGPERMWRVCKARAARANRVPAVEPETVEVG